MMWDDEVDLVCSGPGVGGLASAIAAVDAGHEVFLARSAADDRAEAPQPGYCRAHPWLSNRVVDPETNEYFAALSGDLGTLGWGGRDAEVSIRVVRGEPPADRKRAVEPFVGARLRDWAARCLVSPYGFLHSRISGRGTTPMRTRGGEAIEVTVVGSMEPDIASDAASALTQWLSTEAYERDLPVFDDSPLERMVFEEGDVVGAVFTTPDGPYAVRARRGVTVTTGGLPRNPGMSTASIAGHGPLQVCLVSQTASRFGRVELLTTEPAAAPPRSAYCATNRHLHDSLHEVRPARSQTRRCRKLHRYPPLGQ
jgi:hypothetical protein